MGTPNAVKRGWAVLVLSLAATAADGCMCGPSSAAVGGAENSLALCGDGVDNDYDDLADCDDPDCQSRGFCAPDSAPTDAGQGYTPGVADAGPTEGKPADAGPPVPTDVCGNGLDDDSNGFVDDGCSCSADETQPCFKGPSAARGIGACRDGTQACTGQGELGGSWGACTGAIGPGPEVCDGADNDCDGQVDDGLTGCVVANVGVDIDGDCVSASCPPSTPYPIGCNITMQGGDARGCVANTPTGSTVYFQEGDKCGAGHVHGTLRCSSQPGSGLTSANCALNKTTTYYPASSAGCPSTH